MSYAINWLMNEHDLILRMIRVVGAINKKLQAGEEVSVEDLRHVVDFIRNFADRCHHAKEEDLLFVRMQERGFSAEQGPVAVMLHEHTLGRNFVQGMEEGINEYEKGDQSAAAKIVHNAGSYAQLLSEHIHKENNILYPMANRVFSGEDQQFLEQEFKRVEKEKFGPEVQEKYLKMVQDLEKKYL